MKIEFLIAEYRRVFGGEPQIYQAPGRVNFIGEHTDYNDGLVMPAAINYVTRVAVGKRTDYRIAVRSLSFNETVEFAVDKLHEKFSEHHWSDYVRGIAAVLSEFQGVNPSGANLLIAGEVPLGSGLSSSASLEVSTAFALLGDRRGDLTNLKIARLCQRAENEFAGTSSGIMDQYASIFGEQGKAILLDCRTLEHQTLALPESFDIVVCNTMVKHALAGGEYNHRRAECKEAAHFLREKSGKKIESLRDVTIDDLSRFKNEMPETIYRRARHVVTENNRVLRAADALKDENLKLFGELMLASHASLKNDYEVSCVELDLMVAAAEKLEGFYGGRMMGGGFGGCTINLVAKEFTVQFQAKIAGAYREKTNIIPEIYVCQTTQGAGKIQ